MTQKELAVKLSDWVGCEGYYGQSTISSWERGHRPNTRTLQYLSTFYDCSVEYMLGITDDRSIENAESGKSASKPMVQIQKKDLLQYDGEPVWIESDEPVKTGCWGLVNCRNNSIILKDGTYFSISKLKFNIYTQPSPFSITAKNTNEHALSMEEAVQVGVKKKIWIEPISKYEEVRERYRGWYSYVPKSECFMNAGTGLLLPLSGYKLSYIAFAENSEC